MKKSRFDILFSHLLKSWFHKALRNLFYFFSLVFMIYIGYSRDEEKMPSNLEQPEKILNKRNDEATFLYLDSLYLADNIE